MPNDLDPPGGAYPADLYPSALSATCAIDRPLTGAIAAFLGDLQHANRSAYTLRDYGAELRRFAAHYHGPLNGITAEALRDYFAGMAHLAPATRARREATLASFLRWAERQELIPASPIAKITRVHPEPPSPRGVPRPQVEAILSAIPRDRLRDRVLFSLLFEAGLRIGEALALYIEDLDLTRDDERLHLLGKGQRWRAVLLDDAALVRLVRAYVKQTGYTHGPLFRAAKNGRGGPLRYQSAHALWRTYCARAGVTCTPHQLRHAHATELVNAGVSLPTIRKRLGHQHVQTTLRYAEQSDAAADAELRAWRRRYTR
jgi:site-specific recombinase XerD